MAGQKQGTMIQQNILDLLNSDDLNNGLLGWQMLEIFHPEIAMEIYMQYEKYLRCSNQYGIDKYQLRSIALQLCWCMACPLVCEITVEYCDFFGKLVVNTDNSYIRIDEIATFYILR